MNYVRIGPAYHPNEIPPGEWALRSKERGIRFLGRWQRVIHRIGGWMQDKAYDWSPLTTEAEAIERGWATEWEQS